MSCNKTLAERKRITRNYSPSGSGSPEGVMYSKPGWFYTDEDTGIVYLKTSGCGTTGWEEIVQ